MPLIFPKNAMGVGLPNAPNAPGQLRGAARGEPDRAQKDLHTIEQHLRYCKRTSVWSPR